MSISIDNNNGIINVSQDGNLAKSYFGVSGKFYPIKLNGIIPNGVNVLSINNGYLELLSNTLDNLSQPVYIQVPSNSTSGAGLFFDIVPGGDIIVDSDTQSGYGIGSLVTINGSDIESGGIGSIIMKVKNLETNGFLINIGGDNYESVWENLVINGTSPTSLSNAAELLAQTLAPIPPPPITNPTLKVNPPSSNLFDIPQTNTVSGAGDFTIEWLQYMHTDNDFPRVYSIGQYPAQNAVSIEGGTLYLWLNGSIAGSYDLSTLSNGYLDQWLHIVIAREGIEIYGWVVYSNNIYTSILSISDGSAIPTNGLDFYIGSENAANTYYNGLISNFRWVTGMSIYGSNPPTYPTSPLVGYNGIKLLIGQGTSLSSQLTDQTGYSTITNTNCTYNADSGISGYDGSIQFGTI